MSFADKKSVRNALVSLTFAVGDEKTKRLTWREPSFSNNPGEIIPGGGSKNQPVI